MLDYGCSGKSNGQFDRLLNKKRDNEIKQSKKAKATCEKNRLNRKKKK